MVWIKDLTLYTYKQIYLTKGDNWKSRYLILINLQGMKGDRGYLGPPGFPGLPGYRGLPVRTFNIQTTKLEILSIFFLAKQCCFNSTPADQVTILGGFTVNITYDIELCTRR